MDMLQDPQYKTPDGSALRIWRDAAQNNFLSEREGRPLFDEVIYVEVISPGSRDSSPIFECERVFAAEMNHPAPLRSMQYAQFAQFIADFEKSEQSDASLAGTPLSQWSEMTKAMAASLKAQNIFTVDALASLPDTKLVVIGPDGRTWREKAKAYIDNAKDSAFSTALAAQLERANADKLDLQAQVQALADQVAALQAAQTAPAAPKSAAAPKAAPAAQTAPAAPEQPPSPELDPITGEPVSPPEPII